MPAPMRRVFGDNVQRERKKRNWSQEEFARALARQGHPIHQTTVGKIENGARTVGIEEASAIAALFGVPLADMLTAPASKDEAKLLELQATYTALVADALRKVEELEAPLARAKAVHAEAQQVLDEVNRRLDALRQKGEPSGKPRKKA